ncbi:PqqD family protein [Spirulina sp. CS-785/01]|uniref:PqqD family protein n=1 Tax=Spirulina sp. CS-785/01 TaxID=3021716 RepID=UPI00232D8BE0|nr:PqqD family protein [Spirulina sp. CS-785/01]MDB9313334.1 PqqD family protein [Spirulina sp. CS-785/01]
MQPFELTDKVSLAEEVLLQELAGESVLLNLASESYFGLDDVGTRMLTVLQASESIQGAYEQLLMEYEVEAEPLKEDLLSFIEMLREHGLVVVE